MEHLNGHDVPWISKTASIERFVPPWTVRRELWTELLRLEDSGISTDIMVFSNVDLCASRSTRWSHRPFRPVLEAVRGATPRSTRRSHRPFRPVRVMSAAVGELPVLTIQDPADVVGASVVDCRPPVLPVSIPLSSLSPRTVENARGTSGFNPSRTEGQSIMDMDTNEITIDRIVGFPWNNPGRDVEDELPTPASSPVQCTTPAVMTGESGGPQEINNRDSNGIAGIGTPSGVGNSDQLGTEIFADIHDDVLSGWGSPTDVNRAFLALFTAGNGHATTQLHRNIGPVPTKSAVATGGTVAVARARGHD